jgi:hypothetical protein
LRNNPRSESRNQGCFLLGHHSPPGELGFIGVIYGVIYIS